MIIFYDLMSTLDVPSWSPHVWKIRFVLNYKKVPYGTQYVSYPDIEGVMRGINAAPTGTRADGSPLFTVPAIKDEEVVISDSSRIIEYLETKFPEPKLFPPGTRALQEACTSYLAHNLLPSFRPLVIPSIVYILDPRGQEYFRRTREAAFACPLEEVLPAGPKREEAWQNVFRALDQVSSWLAKSEGAWLGGTHPIYADFVLASWFQWMIKSGATDGWIRVKERNGGRWERYITNCYPYMAV